MCSRFSPPFVSPPRPEAGIWMPRSGKMRSRDRFARLFVWVVTIGSSRSASFEPHEWWPNTLETAGLLAHKRPLGSVPDHSYIKHRAVVFPENWTNSRAPWTNSVARQDNGSSPKKRSIEEGYTHLISSPAS